MAEVLSTPAAELAADPTALLEGHGSADAAAEVQVPSSVAEKQPEQQPEPPRGIYFVRVPRPIINNLESLDTELSACYTKLKAINNKFQVKKVIARDTCCFEHETTS